MLAKADCTGRTGPFDCSAMDWFLERARALGVEHQPPARLVLGRHLMPLGVAPGPAMGRLLQALYERQLDGEVTTTEEGIALARQDARDGDGSQVNAQCDEAHCMHFDAAACSPLPVPGRAL